jgi:hypothetical protein
VLKRVSNLETLITISNLETLIIISNLEILITISNLATQFNCHIRLITRLI